MKTNKTDQTHTVAHAGIATGVLLILITTGCSSQEAGLRLVSYQDAQQPAAGKLDFDRRAYRIEASGDFRIAACSYRGDTTDDDHPLGEYLDLHIYWKPRPGRTPADSSTANALLRYLVATEDGVAVYSGTGFALPDQTGDKHLVVQLESFYLRLERLSGSMDDVLGDCRLEGRLKATRDSGVTTQVLRELERLATR